MVIPSALLQRPLKNKRRKSCLHRSNRISSLTTWNSNGCSASQAHSSPPDVFGQPRLARREDLGDYRALRTIISSYRHKPAGHLKSCGSTGPCSILPISFTRSASYQEIQNRRPFLAKPG